MTYVSAGPAKQVLPKTLSIRCPADATSESRTDAIGYEPYPLGCAVPVPLTSAKLLSKRDAPEM